MCKFVPVMPNASGNIFYFFEIKMDGCEHDLDSCHYFPDGRVIGNKIFFYTVTMCLLMAATTGICKDSCRFAIPDGNSCWSG